MAVEIDLAGPLETPLERVRAGAIALAQGGRRGLWWPDHLMGFFPEAVWSPEFGVAEGQPSPNDLADPFIAAAVAASATPTRRLGTVVTDPLRRHPASLLQSAATLASAGVEFVLGIGAGAAANLAPYGIPLEQRFQRLVEAVALLRDLRATDSPLWGAYGPLRLAGAVAGIPERRRVPIWIGGSGPAFARLAGRVAEGWIPTRLPPEEYARQMGELRRAAERVGRPRPVASMYVWSIVVDSHEAAHRLLEAPFLRSLLFFRRPEYFQSRGLEHPLAGVAPTTDYLPSSLTREQAARAVARVPAALLHDYIVHGTPDDVAAWALELERAGMEHAVLYDVAHLIAGGAPASRLDALPATVGAEQPEEQRR